MPRRHELDDSSGGTDPIPVIADAAPPADAQRQRRPSMAVSLVAWVLGNKAVILGLGMVVGGIVAGAISVGEFNNRIAQLERQVAALQSSYFDLLVRTLGGFP